MAATLTTGIGNLLPPPSDWVVVNDGVMGGVSRSRYGPGSEGINEFGGILSLENNGGFASIRGLINLTPPSPNAKLRLTVKGDGKRYQLRFRTDRGFDGMAYTKTFQTQAGEATEHVFDLSDFAATWRGRRLGNVPALAWEDVAQIGLMISDKQAGEFSLGVMKLAWLLDT